MSAETNSGRKKEEKGTSGIVNEGILRLGSGKVSVGGREVEKTTSPLDFKTKEEIRDAASEILRGPVVVKNVNGGVSARPGETIFIGNSSKSKKK